MEAAGPGAEAGRIPSYSGITSHCVRLTGLWVAEEENVNLKPALPHYSKVCRISDQAVTVPTTLIRKCQKVGFLWVNVSASQLGHGPKMVRLLHLSTTLMQTNY